MADVEGWVDAFDGRRIHARIVTKGGDEYFAMIPLRKFPLQARKIRPGVIFFIEAGGIRLPPRWSAMDIIRAKRKAKAMVDLLFEQSPIEMKGTE